jgi:hypothetical protein
VLKWVAIVLGVLVAATLFAMRRETPRAKFPMSTVTGYLSVPSNPHDPSDSWILAPAAGALVRIQWYADVDAVFHGGHACIRKLMVSVAPNGEFAAPAWESDQPYSNIHIFIDAWAPGQEILHRELDPLEYSGAYRKAAVLRLAAPGSADAQELAFRNGGASCPIDLPAGR